MTTGNEPPAPVPESSGTPQPRDARGNFGPTQAATSRAAAAAKLKADNPKMTYRAIAKAVGYSNPGDAWRAVDSCRTAAKRAAGAELIESEAARLDDLYAMAQEVIEANHVVVSHGKVITMRDPETNEEIPLTDNGPKLQAIQTALRIRESYRKLLGADQPTQVAVSGSVKYEVVGVNPEDLT